jgi:hypothetical protein
VQELHKAVHRLPFNHTNAPTKRCTVAGMAIASVNSTSRCCCPAASAVAGEWADHVEQQALSSLLTSRWNCVIARVSLQAIA